MEHQWTKQQKFIAFLLLGAILIITSVIFVSQQRIQNTQALTTTSKASEGNTDNMQDTNYGSDYAGAEVNFSSEDQGVSLQIIDPGTEVVDPGVLAYGCGTQCTNTTDCKDDLVCDTKVEGNVQKICRLGKKSCPDDARVNTPCLCEYSEQVSCPMCGQSCNSDADCDKNSGGAIAEGEGSSGMKCGTPGGPGGRGQIAICYKPDPLDPNKALPCDQVYCSLEVRIVGATGPGRRGAVGERSLYQGCSAYCKADSKHANYENCFKCLSFYDRDRALRCKLLCRSNGLSHGECQKCLGYP